MRSRAKEKIKGDRDGVCGNDIQFCCCWLRNRLRAHQRTSEQCRRSSRSPEGWCNPLRGLCLHPFRQPRARPDPQPAVCWSVCTRPSRAGTGQTDRTLHTTEGSESKQSLNVHLSHVTECLNGASVLILHQTEQLPFR